MSEPTPAGNRLAQASSPYLLQHASNPVDWVEWSPEAFARAKAENKPVLLSVGYAACHWCHVMAHESFEDPEIAALQNQLFVSIKVDREERPDIDVVYQNALALTGQQGGWPLTMFLTSEGEPFWGGTYFPPTSRWGRPGFPDVLRAIADTYHREGEKVTQNVAALRDGLCRIAETTAGGPVPLELLDAVASRLVREFDPYQGGIGQAPKFPHCPVFELVLRGWLRTGDEACRDAVVTTLDHICQGGIYDHVGGGFARYSTDAAWLVPHFEKMLYDNAQLIGLLTLAWQATGLPLYRQRIAETVDWVFREMLAEDGGFASSLDADSEGEEGKFYVWDKAEIDALLGDRAPLLERVYDVTVEGNWEGKSILHRNHPAAGASQAEEEQLVEDRGTLLAARAKRVRPGWDDKVLTDWNGLMIQALAEAGFVFRKPDWIGAAERAFRAVTKHEADGHLPHSWRQGRVSAQGLLEDYAQMASAALKLHEVTGNPAYLAAAERWVAVLDGHFWDDKAGGYWQRPEEGERLIVRAKSAADHAVPAGNGTMVGVLERLALATGDGDYDERSEALVTTFSGAVERNFFSLATLLNGAEFALRATEIVIIGDREAPDTEALLDVIRRTPLPDRWLTILQPGHTLPEGHPAEGKGQQSGAATAYVCRARVCSAPVTRPEELERVIGE
ncbi:MAG TPA: thioredoxin domain-containing protein [Alphaproteobacteria bacterium]|nr:thioredoxin domain-containing protein [Alphaproteobacteria bacterium]